jgi:DNA-binding CsgD family transcriptional regulator
MANRKKELHRKIEVYEEFAAFKGGVEDDEGHLIGSDWIYLPQWRARVGHVDKWGNVKLGPKYGPSLSNFEREITKHNESTGGGGLWDPEEASKRHECISLVTGEVTKEKQSADVLRYDSAEMDAFVTRHSANIPPRELEVYFAYWRDGLSLGRVAAKLGMTKKYVGVVLLRLRNRMKSLRRSLLASILSA